MGLTAVNASTQDNIAGTPVACCVNEEGAGAGNIQAVIGLANKSTYAEGARTGLTTADTGTTDLTSTGFGTNLVDTFNASYVDVRATCDTPSATLTGRLIFYDGSGNPLAMSGGAGSWSFTSDSSLTIASSGQKYPCPAIVGYFLAHFRQCKFYVDSLSAGTWNIYIAPN